MKLVTGIDDVGSMNARSEGWTFFTIPECFLGEFVTNATSVLNETKLEAFHGKAFARRFEKSYKRFLTLVRDTLSKGNASLLASTLLNEKWKTKYSEFCQRVISGAFSGAGIDEEALTQASVALATPLFTYQRLASGFPVGSSTRFEIDADSVTERLPQLALIVRANSIAPTTPIFAAYNAYRTQRFESSPSLDKGGIQVTSDEQSFLIQAADLFANFSVAYAFQKLGKHSKTGDLKAGIFADCFSDLLPNVDFEANVEISGEDLVLTADGSWTLYIR